MIKINNMSVRSNFKYLWLKGVNDVDLTNHCARSLIGEYSKVINKDNTKLSDVALDVPVSKAYYLCGVSDPFVYNKNFHLAFKEKEGSILKVNNNGIEIELLNAVEIPFSISDIDNSLPQTRYKRFTTCRNWQFANKFKRGIND